MDTKHKESYSAVKYVQVEGLVSVLVGNRSRTTFVNYQNVKKKRFVFKALMKIAKHCHEECASDVIIAQGALLGLVVEDCLEITNCFAFPKSVDESINDGEVFLFIQILLLVCSS